MEDILGTYKNGITINDIYVDTAGKMQSLGFILTKVKNKNNSQKKTLKFIFDSINNAFINLDKTKIGKVNFFSIGANGSQKVFIEVIFGDSIYKAIGTHDTNFYYAYADGYLKAIKKAKE